MAPHGKTTPPLRREPQGSRCPSRTAPRCRWRSFPVPPLRSAPHGRSGGEPVIVGQLRFSAPPGPVDWRRRPPSTAPSGRDAVQSARSAFAESSREVIPGDENLGARLVRSSTPFCWMKLVIVWMILRGSRPGGRREVGEERAGHEIRAVLREGLPAVRDDDVVAQVEVRLEGRTDGAGPSVSSRWRRSPSRRARFVTSGRARTGWRGRRPRGRGLELGIGREIWLVM